VTPTGPAGRCTARRRPRTTFTRARSASEFLAAQFDVLDDDELHQLATLWAKVSDSV
jgi:hypothetical protein